MELGFSLSDALYKRVKADFFGGTAFTRNWSRDYCRVILTVNQSR